MFEPGTLADNYLHHPGYDLGVAHYTVNQSRIAEFDRRYRALSGAEARTGANSAAAQAELTDMAREICHEMQEQAADRFESRFLEVLETQVLRELREELGYYAKAAQGGDDSRAASGKLAALRAERHFFGHLGAAATGEILEASAATLEMLRGRAAAGQLTRDLLSINQGPVVKKIVRVLNREFRAQGVLDAVSAYMGKPYHVSGLALELSVPQAMWWRDTGDMGQGIAPRTLYAHLDESIVYPKSIVYLSDVGPDNGPTTCYPHVYEALALNGMQELVGRVVHYPCWSETCGLREYYGAEYHQPMSSERFRCHFMRLPPELRFDSHMGWSVLAGSALEQYFVNQEKVMTGPPGTFIAFDGARLFHRGGLLEQGERIVLQVIFGPEPSLAQRFVSFPARVVRKLGRMLK